MAPFIHYTFVYPLLDQDHKLTITSKSCILNVASELLQLNA